MIFEAPGFSGLRLRERRLRATTCLLVASLAGCGGGAGGPGNVRPPRWLQETGFEARATWPSALLHLSRSEIGRAGQLTTLLRSVPGLEIRIPRGEDWGVYRELSGGGRCAVTVVVNGAYVSRRTLGGDWTLDFLARTRDMHGLELHVGEEGPLMDEGGCGVLLLWSDLSPLDGGRVDRRLLEADEPFRGQVTGTFWGDGAETVVEVVLEPGGQIGTFDRQGEFLFRDVLPGPYRVVVRSPSGALAREPVRVYAYADSWIDVPLGGRRPSG